MRDAFKKLPEVTQVMCGQVGIWTEVFKSRACAFSHYYIVQLASPQTFGLSPAVSFCALWHIESSEGTCYTVLQLSVYVCLTH